MRPVTTFRFGKRAPASFVDFTRRVLKDARGWSKYGCTFIESEEKPDVIIRLLSAHEMNKLYGKYKELRGLSVTNRGSKPMTIHIHRDNWDDPPETFIASNKFPSMSRIEQYRTYVINHEAGHTLGLDHPEEARKPDGGCKIMYQQTKGTGKTCKARPWP